LRIGEMRFAGALSTIDAPMTMSHSICPRCAGAQPAPKSHGEPVQRAEQPVRD